jgi:hypothetical protein
MRSFVTLLWVASVALVLLERFSAATIKAFTTHFSIDSLRQLACEGVAAFPEGLFLLGLWWIRETLATFARGELFATEVTRMLDRVGVTLALGSIVRILIVPGACRLLGFDAGHWIAFDAAGLVLGAVGVSLKAIGGVLGHAASVQAELDEIF